jgi:hypothetical protein
MSSEQEQVVRSGDLAPPSTQGLGFLFGLAKR